MKRNSFQLTKIAGVLLLLLLFAGAAFAQPLQFSIKGTGPNDYEGCEDYNVTFTAVIPGSASIDEVQMVNNDRTITMIRDSEWLVNGRKYTFDLSLPAGNYSPILRVKRGGNDWEEIRLTSTIKVYTNPTALMRIVGDSSQCFEDNSICFEDLSKPGKEGHILVDTVVDLGSGDVIKKGTFCYSYPEPGTFTYIVSVIDEKGCSDEYVATKHIEIYRDIGARFKAVGPVGCPCTDIRFNNKTKLDIDKVDRWIWDWGSGKGKNSKDTFYSSNTDHVDNWWTGFTREYCRDGYHSPKLVVYSKDGCVDSFIDVDAIRVINYNFDITWTPDTACFAGNNVTFNMPPRPNATQLEWNFGDPASMQMNVNREDWNPSHRFVGGPSWYNVSLTILEPPCPIRDTTICFIKLKGPMAIIKLPEPPFSNNCVDPVEIAKEDFTRLKYDECHRANVAAMDPAGDKIGWVTVDNTVREKNDSIFVYCNAKVASYENDTNKSALDNAAESCNDEYVTHPIPTLETPVEGVNGNWRYRYYDYTQSTSNTWEWDDPIPVRDSLQITDSLTPLGGGSKVLTTFWVYHPFMRPHEVNINGKDYIFRITETPIKHNKGTYYPPMYPGTRTKPNRQCGDNFRTMHDTDIFTKNCGGPNLVQFVNNTIKYRIHGKSGSEKPPHHWSALDNFPDAYSFPNSVDGCRDNPNWPWASDSMEYLWDFGDNSDQCTTYYDANGNMAVNGSNPTGDPLQCKFSTIVAPQHLYVEEDCWTAVLTVYDPVTGCESVATQDIVMEAPNAAPDDPNGALTEMDVNYSNQLALANGQNEDGEDFRMGLRLGHGAPPCVGNDLNPYFQDIDISGTLPSCNRQKFWMIFNREDDCAKTDCSIDGNGKIVKQQIIERGALHTSGTHKIEFRVKNSDGSWGPAYAKGEAKINKLGFLDGVKITESDSGYVNNAKAQMVFVDSSAFDKGDVLANPILVYGYEQVDSFWYQCSWITDTDLAGMGMKWSYATPGCKTPGLVIKTGDCLDTFFYENYRYFLDPGAEFLINPHPNSYLNEEEKRKELDGDDDNPIRKGVYAGVDKVTCNETGEEGILPTKLPFKMVFSVKDYQRNDPLAADAHPICDASDSLRTFKYFISKTANQCGRATKGYPADSLALMPDGFEPMAGGDAKLINLRDTLEFSIKEPGKYVISASARAKHGAQFCFGAKSREVWLGQFQCFRYSDSVICKEEAVTFVDSIFYWHKGGSGYCAIINWWQNTTCIDTAIHFYAPDRNASRLRWKEKGGGKWYADDYIPEMIAWDFNAPRYQVDENGNRVKDALGNDIRMEDWMRKMDESLIDLWIDPTTMSDEEVEDLIAGMEKTQDGRIKPNRQTEWTYGTTEEFGVGVYDVTLWARDSMGCWMPYTKRNAVRVVDVEARFALCDTCQDTMVCTPAATGFVDFSVIKENKEDVPSGESEAKGVYDEIVSWEWDFGDGRRRSILSDPKHTYLDANEDGYDVKLVVVTAEGCVSEITKPKLIKIIGPRAEFALLTDTICVDDSVHLVDQSYFKGSATRIWSGINPSNGAVGSRKNTEGKKDTVGLFFSEPGDYNITLSLAGKVKDPVTGVEKDCQDIYPNKDADEEDLTVHVRPYDTLNITLNDTLFCPGDLIIAQVHDSTYDGYDTFYWTFADVDEVSERSDVHEFSYMETGQYKITLSGTGAWPICPMTAETEITVKSIEADITVDESRSNRDLGNYEFINKSVNGELFVWEVFESANTNTPIATFFKSDTSRLVYSDFTSGDYLIKLRVYDLPNRDDSTLACSSFDTIHINVDPLIDFYNVFSPNGDGENDMWSITMQAIPEYDLVIYNRWGERVFSADQEDVVHCEMHESTAKRVCQFWDGTNTKGNPAAPGTYYFVFKYRFKGESEVTSVNGSITLLRGRGE